jgi:hypothetical protein
VKEMDLQKWMVCIDGRFEFFDTKLKTYERTKKYTEIGCVERWKYTKAIICNTNRTYKNGLCASK